MMSPRHHIPPSHEGCAAHFGKDFHKIPRRGETVISHCTNRRGDSAAFILTFAAERIAITILRLILPICRGRTS
jgi:hypothetical protein